MNEKREDGEPGIFRESWPLRFLFSLTDFKETVIDDPLKFYTNSSASLSRASARFSFSSACFSMKMGLSVPLPTYVL